MRIDWKKLLISIAIPLGVGGLSAYIFLINKKRVVVQKMKTTLISYLY